MTGIRSTNKEVWEKGIVGGSALILVVVLTSLLAIVGVMFVMISRIDRMATSGISEDKQLDLAVDTVVGEICGQLVWDVPGTVIPDSMIFPLGMIFPEGVRLFPDGFKHPEYQDYPGPEDRWLAASEPNNVRTWPQISDVTGYIARRGWRTRNIPIAVVPDHSPIALDPASGRLLDQPADADGDGIADAKWFALEGVTSSRGEPIYVAVRVTDNGGKINVNTAFVFDPGSTDVNSIDGTSPLQINLLALANRPGVLPAAGDADALLLARANHGVNVYSYRLDLYEDNVIWRYGELRNPYTPFDISDELELRNRFLLNQEDIVARIEQLGSGSPAYWASAFRIGLKVPIDQGGSRPPTGVTSENWWFNHANISGDPSVYDYRHLATTYSMDRIINPVGLSLNNGKMVNVNTTNVFALMGAIKNAILDANPAMLPLDAEKLAGQLAANIKDFQDGNSDVTPVWEDPPTGSGTRYYGYERPCIYISEVAGIYTTDGVTNYKSFAVELYKPYSEDKDVAGWRLKIPGVNDVSISWSRGDYHVILYEFPRKTDLARIVDPGAGWQNGDSFSLEGKTIYLQRSGGLGSYITVDSHFVPSGWLPALGPARSFKRDISRHKCIRRLWQSASDPNVTLGRANGYPNPDSAIVQAHPYLDPNVYTDGFKNVGEIGMVFDVDAYDYNAPDGSIDEADLRLDLQKNQYARLLNYLTVVDPTSDGRDSDGDGTREDLGLTDLDEKKVPGRININTAPPFVLEQLPWIAPPPARDPAIAIAIAAYRDGVVKGFGSISELLWVPEMAFYRDVAVGDQDGFPELTPIALLGARDGAADDIEERDLIFHRVSNLVTVRSDVFTAYILVRLGADGPQRRMVAILDRSGVVPISSPPYTAGRVKIRALHRMADAW